MRQVGEPSVEEILESIKKVIARDNRMVANEERRHRESDGMREPAGSAEDEVFDLPASAELIEQHPADDAAVPEGPLLSESSRYSMRESLAALAMLAEPGAPPQIVRSGETSLEGMVRELLRPALAEWLDKHLPELVESMVAAEIARIVGKKA